MTASLELAGKLARRMQLIDLHESNSIEESAATASQISDVNSCDECGEERSDSCFANVTCVELYQKLAQRRKVIGAGAFLDTTDLKQQMSEDSGCECLETSGDSVTSKSHTDDYVTPKCHIDKMVASVKRRNSQSLVQSGVSEELAEKLVHRIARFAVGTSNYQQCLENSRDFVTAKSHSDSSVTAKERIDDSATAMSHTENSVTAKEHIDDSVTSKDHTENSVTAKSHTENYVTDKSHTENSVTAKEHIDDSVTDKGHTENSVISKCHVDEKVANVKRRNSQSLVQSGVSEELAEKLAHRIARSAADSSSEVSLETNIMLLARRQSDVQQDIFQNNLLDSSTSHSRVASHFTRRELKRLKEAFVKYDLDKDNFIGFDDLKFMMEKLGIPQTHLALKSLIREVDEDNKNKINFKEFLMIFKKARAGELDYCNEGLLAWFEVYIGVDEIAVDEVGVKEAKNFFESKIALSTMGNKYERELKEEQLQRQLEEEAKRARAQEFKEKRLMFS